ncbi:hypothetical protein [Algoriphagus boritolerans]
MILLKIFRGSYEFAQSARIALSAMLLFTALGHFVFTKGMTLMLPDFIPYKTAVVYATGVIEIAAAIGLFVPSMRLLVGWLLIIFFVLILPANIYAAIHKVDIQNATFGGNGVAYLWFRIPMQILLIFWVYYSAVKFH